MASLDSIKMRKALERGVIVQNGADTPIQIRLRYTGTGSATSVTVSTGTNIVTVSTESTGVVTKTYAFATFITVGALADQINSDGIFEAKVLDALRSDSTTGTNFQVTGAIVAGLDTNGVVVWDMLTDTSLSKDVTACVSFSRNFNTAVLARSHRVHINQIDYFATLGGAGANLVRIYLRRGGFSGLGSNIETQIFGGISVSGVATSIAFGDELGITGNDGDELIVRIQDGTSVSDTGLSLRVRGILE